MHLQINGAAKQYDGKPDLESLVQSLELKSDRVAVELNLSIVARANWAATSLKDGDKLEIVHFVGGGLS